MGCMRRIGKPRSNSSVKRGHAAGDVGVDDRASRGAPSVEAVEVDLDATQPRLADRAPGVPRADGDDPGPLGRRHRGDHGVRRDGRGPRVGSLVGDEPAVGAVAAAATAPEADVTDGVTLGDGAAGPGRDGEAEGADRYGAPADHQEGGSHEDRCASSPVRRRRRRWDRCSGSRGPGHPYEASRSGADRNVQRRRPVAPRA